VDAECRCEAAGMETTTIQHRHYCSRQERTAWMTRYRSSGLLPQPFAEQHGLKLSTLRRWIQQEGYSRLPNAEAAGFQELLLPSVSPAGGWAAEVQLPDGVVVRLSAAATSSWIVALLKTVRPSC
jgi:hypothetical protein